MSDDEIIRLQVETQKDPSKRQALVAACARRGHGPFKLEIGLDVFGDLYAFKICATCRERIQGGHTKWKQPVEIDL